MSTKSFHFSNLLTPIDRYTGANTPMGAHPGVTDWRGSSNGSVDHRNRDTAYYLGYLIPFGYHSSLTVNPDGKTYNNTGHPNISDYQNDNLTPNIVRYEARFRNINDVNEGQDDENRAAHISAVTLKASWNPIRRDPNSVGDPKIDALRVQKIYVPAQFVTVGGHARNDNWFRAQDFTFTVYNVTTHSTATVKLTWNDMVNLGMLSGTVSGTGTSATFTGDTNTSAAYPGTYAVDLEKYLRLTELKQAKPGLSATQLFDELAASHGLNLVGRTGDAAAAK